MPSATISNSGRLTLPKCVRECLGVRTGDLVEFVVSSDGEIRVRAGSVDVSEIRGLLRRPRLRAVSVTAMHKAVRTAARRW